MGFIMNAGLFYFLFLVLSWAIYGLYERVELEGDERSFLFFFLRNIHNSIIHLPTYYNRFGYILQGKEE